ncbi:bifunctional riboflavin kinase/FAD synthetase [Salipaludibacillus sp. CUR1]|uniref:bifunctional riboflavin kinase/FAD synthetase n=1 Tax=Salipaludibacillus sp. CUR1 TaxID=2820003 RepID=UPI001E40F37A|nr:bifunctional riboflavin kinase/FAD synthetase [Salipaludibacillus sp. CUR1]MCE7794559.1 bifunctional riboflavin kinase/FAD synthetase [Salipaludibacillus sp. CUR1]
MEIIHLKHPHRPVNLPPTVTALGFFDGVHLGHRKVIETAVKKAADEHIYSAVMTFFPHPKEVLGKNGGYPVRYLSPLEEKEKLIEKTGVDYLFIVEFTSRFSELSPQQFVDDYLIDLNVKHVVAGFDYSYGRLGKGTMETMPFHSRNLITQTTVEKVAGQEGKISSTSIREAMAKGEIDKVNSYLGRNYKITGVVEHGEKRGRTIGFPTANVSTDAQKEIPAAGVYAVTFKVNGKMYSGVCNIGSKPTFHDETAKQTIEVHLLDTEKNLYDEKVEVVFLGRIRGEIKFDGAEALIAQINKDIAEARSFF